MDSKLQFTVGDDDSGGLSEEEYFRITSSSGDDEGDSYENDSDTAETREEIQVNGLGPGQETCLGDAPGFRSTEDFLDKVFTTEDEAYAAYKQFARLRGFGVRKGDVAHQLWKVRRIDDNHNHPLATTMFTHLLPSHRNMSESDKAQVDSLKKFGIATSKIMAYMAGQSGDAAAAISYLEGKVNADMMTVARYTKTTGDQLGSLFWADGQMMADYQLFGDVLAFDATYRSNKYKKPLVVFSGSNHHKQTAIFGFALLQDEEVRTYRWMLLNMLDVMESKKPSVVVTDGDKAMRAAIADVLPSARHRLCGWHLEKNCVLRVKEPEFRKVFKKAVYANFDVAEFEEYWRTAVKSLGLMENSWVKSTYELRQSWATAYLRGTFCTSYKTTSRCEGINAFVKGFLKSTNSLLELVQSLDRVVKDYRNNELYTRAVFKEVRKQIKGVGSLLFLGKDSISTTSVYKFSSVGNRSRVRKVLYDPSEPKIECDCMMWNSEGIPCCHIFCVMKYEGLGEIPPGLILRRWCKDAKEWTASSTCDSLGHTSRLLRYGALCSSMSVVAKLASDDAADFFLARDALTSLARRLQLRRGNTVAQDERVREQDVVRDPAVTRTKGAPKRGREMGSSTNAVPGGKRRCCTSCGLPSHTKRTCMSQRETSQAGYPEGTSATIGDPSSGEPSGNRSGRSCSEVCLMIWVIFDM
ncbi:hypothetical protein Ahy_B05g078429 isoform A [Arachis hypogaea]|uniref:SWIM-type domain-containing protein n=1 Tax=Arachis hypogaea TaxID=3818 RepID=A0A444Z729_ARAHY|nr:hypothetical protein Ahy_B05g078429 isoform A [Arachis hypogaea]